MISKTENGLWSWNSKNSVTILSSSINTPDLSSKAFIDDSKNLVLIAGGGDRFPNFVSKNYLKFDLEIEDDEENLVGQQIHSTQKRKPLNINEWLKWDQEFSERLKNNLSKNTSLSSWFDVNISVVSSVHPTEYKAYNPKKTLLREKINLQSKLIHAEIMQNDNKFIVSSKFGIYWDDVLIHTLQHVNFELHDWKEIIQRNHVNIEKSVFVSKPKRTDSHSFDWFSQKLTLHKDGTIEDTSLEVKFSNVRLIENRPSHEPLIQLDIEFHDDFEILREISNITHSLSEWEKFVLSSKNIDIKKTEYLPSPRNINASSFEWAQYKYTIQENGKLTKEVFDLELKISDILPEGQNSNEKITFEVKAKLNDVIIWELSEIGLTFYEWKVLVGQIIKPVEFEEKVIEKDAEIKNDWGRTDVPWICFLDKKGKINSKYDLTKIVDEKVRNGLCPYGPFDQSGSAKNSNPEVSEEQSIDYEIEELVPSNHDKVLVNFVAHQMNKGKSVTEINRILTENNLFSSRGNHAEWKSLMEQAAIVAKDNIENTSPSEDRKSSNASNDVIASKIDDDFFNEEENKDDLASSLQNEIKKLKDKIKQLEKEKKEAKSKKLPYKKINDEIKKAKKQLKKLPSKNKKFDSNE